MQVFTVTVKVTVNTAETASAAEIQEELEELLDEFIGGTAEVVSVKE